MANHNSMEQPGPKPESIINKSAKEMGLMQRRQNPDGTLSDVPLTVESTGTLLRPQEIVRIEENVERLAKEAALRKDQIENVKNAFVKAEVFLRYLQMHEGNSRVFPTNPSEAFKHLGESQVQVTRAIVALETKSLGRLVENPNQELPLVVDPADIEALHFPSDVKERLMGAEQALGFTKAEHSNNLVAKKSGEGLINEIAHAKGVYLATARP